MVDITFKQNSLRTAIAQATVTVSKQATIDAIVNNEIPKGNVFEMAKTAGLFAVKKTSDTIPDCHPLPVEFTKVDYEIDGLNIIIQITVSTIYKTGVEVEAMHGASVIALTMYDMLKPVDKGVEINNIKLLMKTGGKSGLKKDAQGKVDASFILSSKAIIDNKKEDKLSLQIKDTYEQFGLNLVYNVIIANEEAEIKSEVLKRVKAGDDLIITSGGTGLSESDKLPETVIPLLDKRIPGIEEVIRRYGQERTPKAMFSRSVAGLINKSLIICLPGSSAGLKESLKALFPYIIPAFDVKNI